MQTKEYIFKDIYTGRLETFTVTGTPKLLALADEYPALVTTPAGMRLLERMEKDPKLAACFEAEG